MNTLYDILNRRKSRWPLLLAAVLIAAVCLFGRDAQRPLRFLQQQSTGQVVLQVNVEGSLQQMPLETYLLGVVAAEMPASFDAEALAAQAVAARTYTVRKLLHGGCSGGQGDICTDSAHCQAWCSVRAMQDKWGADFSDNYEKMRQAVDKTAGQVLCYDGQVIEALFHSSSSGSTEACVQVFSQDLPYLQSVTSPEAVNASTQVYPYAQCLQLIQTQLGDTGLSEANLAGQLKVTDRTAAGRVQTLQVGQQTISGSEARKLFSLRSADFTVQCSGGQVVFSVEGYGHGVGMSQYGADALAHAGYTWQQILAHYYVDTQLAQVAEVL